MTDILYVHIEDLGEPLRTLYGINVYGDPSFKTAERHEAWIKTYISFSSTQEYPATYVESRTYDLPTLSPLFDLQDGKLIECKDKAMGTLACFGSAEHTRWSLHKDSGMSYWNYTPEEMQRVIALET